ncbi:hypothetical protein HETIRDRAFT_145757 [Heterobasidion irregulare TC 32-1]|uniref:Uncharacterized protein n=1 Tax=Heterobasidion irregulare (strain TC 32-1) TaxID=747525 RepID=W4KK43_HETIT|nr:uncharacterized protein HETIRDRAFT_145757 [Heterobasidion irregulare TC 32-1]ETW86074.1 hypothetical protein HETIRDRAFT_145757 [Heterobasidion irregulare TC 32-1]
MGSARPPMKKTAETGWSVRCSQCKLLLDVACCTNVSSPTSRVLDNVAWDSRHRADRSPNAPRITNLRSRCLLPGVHIHCQALKSLPSILIFYTQAPFTTVAHSHLLSDGLIIFQGVLIFYIQVIFVLLGGSMVLFGQAFLPSTARRAGVLILSPGVDLMVRRSHPLLLGVLTYRQMFSSYRQACSSYCRMFILLAVRRSQTTTRHYHSTIVHSHLTARHPSYRQAF